HVIALLLAERVGGDDVDPVALRGADEGERRAGRAAGVLDDGVAGLQATVELGALDDRARHPILEAAGGIFPLELDVDLGGGGGRELAQPHQRRVADGLEDVSAHRGGAQRAYQAWTFEWAFTAAWTPMSFGLAFHTSGGTCSIFPARNGPVATKSL